jgi:hypothetical protein
VFRLVIKLSHPPLWRLITSSLPLGCGFVFFQPQAEQIHAAEATSRKVVREPADSPNAPPHLSDACQVLVDVAEPPNMQRAFETTLSLALLENHLAGLESSTGVALLERDRQGRVQVGVAGLQSAGCLQLWYSMYHASHDIRAVDHAT